MKLKRELEKIIKKQKLDIDILEINDKKNIRQYKVLQTPTLVINDEYKYNVYEINNNVLNRLVMFCSLV